MKKILRYIVVLSAGLSGMSACTDNFEKIHDGYFGVTEKDLTRDNQIVGAGFQNIMKAVYRSTAGYDYQTYQNLNADVFSGYMATPSFPGRSQMTYVPNAGWNDACWNNGYNVMGDWLSNQEACMKYGFPDLGVIEDADEAMAMNWKESVYCHYIAVNTVCKILGMSRMVDQYGPIIYSKWGTDDFDAVTYDSVEAIYDSFFAELAEAVEVLDAAAKDPGSYADFTQFDMVFQGKMDKWARLANSLRARFAMRIVKAAPEKAKAQFEAAVAAPQGTMGKGDNYTMVDNNGFDWFNSLWTCSIGYGDIYISANIESIMGGYGDPRLPMFGLTPPKGGSIKGIRTGLPDTVNESGTRKEQYGPVISQLNIPNTDYRTIVVYGAETLFLKAEAALRGWNAGDGTAQSFYEQGIEASFSDWGVSGAAYASSHATPADYEDPLYDEFDIAAMSDVTPNWADAATDEERLEKIITQKWIAMFPEGMNAWAEYRRTGYPKQFPIVQNDSGGDIPTDLGFRRLTYTVREGENNPGGVASGVAHLGTGGDKVTTRIWWDKDVDNF